MSHAGDKTRIWVNRFVKLIVFLVIAYGAFWVYTNWDYIRDRGSARYEEERYGVLWRTNLRAAKEFAKEHKRQIMLVYLNSGTNNVASNTLISTVFPSRSFQAAAQTYIPLLCDVRHGVEEGARIQNNQSELIKDFGLGTSYGTLIRIDADGRELERVVFSNQGSVDLINKLAGGKFVALAPVKRPEIKDPVKDKVVEGTGKAKSLVGSEGTITTEPAPAAPAVPAAAAE